MVIIGTIGIKNNSPSAKQKRAKPISESESCNFSLTLGIYKTQVPIIMFKELKTQTTEKYRQFERINRNEYI